MNKIKILVCEDVKEDQMDIELYLDELNTKFSNLEIEAVIKDFSSVIPELKNEYQLLILDFFDGNVQKGERILNHNTLKIPTIIYTSKAESEQVDYGKLEIEYPFLRKYLPKLRTGENLKDYIISFAFSEGLLNRNYTLYNDNDIFLHNSINSIGVNQFNEILYQLIDDVFKTGEVIIHRMTSGLSGASIFKIENNNLFSILKVSREKEKLKKEHENAIALYNKFPNRFINHINHKEYYSFDKNVLGILIKEVNDSETFFDFILKNSTTKESVESFLEELFLSDQSLKTHYIIHRLADKKDWTFIFNKLDNLKFSLVILAVKELEPLLTNYYPDFKIGDIKNLVVNNCYGVLDKNILLDQKYQKQLVLSHGDLHSKNILVQSSKIPVIIDTGAISNNFWCMDICRLIVNLFILGYDNNSIDFYDINKIDMNIKTVESIINQVEIQFDNKNDNIITSLNWLIKNCNDIYGDLYCVFEFQLGLMKEFLQIAYRVDTIPPNKRAIALISAYRCMLKANENI